MQSKVEKASYKSKRAKSTTMVNVTNGLEQINKKTLNSAYTLPVSEARASIVQMIRKHPAVIIVGETGSGKTTQIPQYVLDEVIQSNDSNKRTHAAPMTSSMVGCTQPRRVAAVSIARYVAQQRQSVIGGEVAYAVRFDDTCTEQTRLKYMTDGILLREIQADPLLSKYACILLDEAHERTLHGDVLFGLLKDIVRQRRREQQQQQEQQRCREGKQQQSPKNTSNNNNNNNTNTSGSGDTNNDKINNIMLPELKIVVMSATLNAEQFSKFWWNAPIGIVHGRTHPVSLLHTIEPQADYVEAAVSTILQIHIHEESGDVLCFLTGQEEIEDAKRILEQRMKALPSHISDFVVLTLYAAMPYDQQLQIFDPTPHQERKVILATNIAETSITVEGIKYVVDSGVVKAKYYNSKTGMEALAEVDVSKAQATQRAGRAGRMTAGKCFRLYTSTAFEMMRENTIPEIRRSSLMSVVLQMKRLHINHIMQFEFMDTPNARAVAKAEETLMLLRALDHDGVITLLGMRLTDFPVDPMAAMVLLAGKAMHVEREVVLMIALTATENLFFTSRASKEGADKCRNTYARAAGDHATLLNLYRAYHHVPTSERASWCESNSLNYRQLLKAEDIATQLYAVLMDESKEATDERILRQLVSSALYRDAQKGVVRVPGKRARNEGSEDDNNTHTLSHLESNAHNEMKRSKPHYTKSHYDEPIRNNGLECLPPNHEAVLAPSSTAHVKQTVTYDYEFIRRALCHGYFLNTAFYNAKLGFYQTIIGQQVVHIHPSSVLFTHRKKPALVLFNSVVRTTKRYMKDVSVIHEAWLQEAAPNFFRPPEEPQ